MKIAFANDHAGYGARDLVLRTLREAGHEVIDFGSNSPESVDYPDYAQKACEAVVRKQAERAVLVCGTGQGMVIAANKVPGIRAARCLNVRDAELARSHNDANVITLGGGWGRENGQIDLPAILKAWLTTKFEGGRHQRRLDKIARMEKHCGDASGAKKPRRGEDHD